MKILCPLDFSDASVNAIKYAASLFGRDEEGHMEIVHCINITSRAMMFIKLDDLLEGKAKEDMDILVDRMRERFPNIKVETKIIKADPKYFLPNYAEKKGFDFVALGTKGMTQLKDLTIGSLTEAMFENSNVPVLAIPEDAEHDDIKHVVLAIDDEAVAKDDLLNPLTEIMRLDVAKIHLVHVKEGGDDELEYDPAIDLMLKGFDYDYKALDKGDQGIGDTIHAHLDEVQADMLVFIHHKRNWFQRLFNMSHTKERLYTIKRPLLVIQA